MVVRFSLLSIQKLSDRHATATISWWVVFINDNNNLKGIDLSQLQLAGLSLQRTPHPNNLSNYDQLVRLVVARN